MTDLVDDLVSAARALDRHDLVSGFGHVSARSADGALITRAGPLGRVRDGSGITALPLDRRPELGPGVPGEAWIHRAVYAQRADVLAICRAQPQAAEAAAVAHVEVRVRHGQGALVGDVAVWDDARLLRNPDLAEGAAGVLGERHALLLRGNGAVTVGRSIGEAVARMWVLERSATIALAACAGAAQPTELSRTERQAWEQVSAELLARIWDYLRD